MSRWSDLKQKLKSKIKSIKFVRKYYIYGVMFLIGGMLASCALKAPKAVSIGSAAPAFTLKDFSGAEHSLSEWKGKVIFIDFWASWCPPCRAVAPTIEEMYNAYKNRNDPIQFIGINLDQNTQQAQNFITEHKISYIVLQGSTDVAKQYGVSGIPAFFIIDAEGNIAHSAVGFKPGLDEEWRAEIDTLLSRIK